MSDGVTEIVGEYDWIKEYDNIEEPEMEDDTYEDLSGEMLEDGDEQYEINADIDGPNELDDELNSDGEILDDSVSNFVIDDTDVADMLCLNEFIPEYDSEFDTLPVFDGALE